MNKQHIRKKYTYLAQIKKYRAEEQPVMPPSFFISVNADNDAQARKYVEKVCSNEYEIDLIAIEDNN